MTIITTETGAKIPDHRHSLRGKTAAQLASENPIPAAKEMVLASDTGAIRIGDGTTPWLDLPDSITTPAQIRATIAAQIPAKISTAVSALGGKLMAHDDYKRPDATIAQFTMGEHLPSGQRYQADGSVASHSVAAIAGGLQVWTDETTVGATPIRILKFGLNYPPDSILKAAVFLPGSDMATLDTFDSVIGGCAVSFATQSVQFALSPNSWELFLTGPYGSGGAFAIVPLGGGVQALDSPLAADGVTPWLQQMDLDWTTSTITASLDGVVLGSVTDSRIVDSWGRFVCSQFRKNTSGGGIVRSAGVYAAAA